MAAAPKPLSIFTTETPLAQLLSIPSSAASPPKLAPYPTLVGTAMTGTSTRPPTTLGQRALHAGHDDDDPRGGEAGMLGQEPVEAGDADVVEPVDGVAHRLGTDGRFLGDGQVGGPGGRNEGPSPSLGRAGQPSG